MSDPVRSGPEARFAPMEISGGDFRRLAEFIQRTYGIDLSKKRQLITGRLSSTLRQRGYDSCSQFVDHLLKEKDNEEITLVLNQLTTNYTFFMREKEHLTLFCQKIIPELVQRHRRGSLQPDHVPLRLSGLPGQELGHPDPGNGHLRPGSHCRQAGHLRAAGHPAPPSWKSKYFTANSDGTHTVAPVVRDNVIFRHFNLMDPIRFHRKFDVIFCRNVMIYFDQPTKVALVQRFYDATVPGGYFLISYSENLSPRSPYRRLAPATFQK